MLGQKGKRMKSIVIFAISTVFFVTVHCSRESWTHYYPHKVQSPAHHHKHYYYEKLVTKPFTQLLFSWNAKRPSRGYFSFYTQLRNAANKQWTQWHHMVDWGKSVQKSYVVEHNAPFSYRHVRFETGAVKADAYRIKIVAHQGASLADLKRVAISCADFTQFVPENPTITNASSVMISGLPSYSQMKIDHSRFGGMCSPTSVSMVAAYLTECSLNPLEVAQDVYDSGLDAYGSWPFNTAELYLLLHGCYYVGVVRLPSFFHLYKQLSQGIPVIVSVRGPLIGSATPYAAGHLLVVVGWDNDTKEVICHDPAFDDPELVLKRYPLADFLIAWERSHRLSYFIEKISL